MKDEEANEIIAEYMGIHDIEYDIENEYHCKCGVKLLEHKNLAEHPSEFITEYPCYSESLDVLVPVWDKLPCISIMCDITGQSVFRIDYYTGDKCDRSFSIGGGVDIPIQQAAAHATAQAIQGLK